MNFQKYFKVKQEEKTIVACLNNPPANALNSVLMQELKSILDWADNKDADLLIITGEGKFFSAGADIKELKELSQKNLRSRKKFIQSNNDILNQIENFPKPVIALINGYALGGGLELALACHFRLAGSAVKVGLPEINLGIFPGWGGTFRLPKLVGKSKALDIILSGKIITAEDALRIGLIDKLVDSTKLLEEAKNFSKDFIGKPAEALKCARSAIINDMNQKEVADVFAKLLSKDCAKEGISKFLDKNKG